MHVLKSELWEQVMPLLLPGGQHVTTLLEQLRNGLSWWELLDVCQVPLLRVAREARGRKVQV